MCTLLHCTVNVQRLVDTNTSRVFDAQLLEIPDKIPQVCLQRTDCVVHCEYLFSLFFLSGPITCFNSVTSHQIHVFTSHSNDFRVVLFYYHACSSSFKTMTKCPTVDNGAQPVTRSRAFITVYLYCLYSKTSVV